MSNYSDYLDGKDLIRYADAFAEEQHEGQNRRSGEPYITHPRAVAEIVKNVGGDPEMIAAGLLHDVIEDTDATEKELKGLFGSRVASLVKELTIDAAVDNNPDKSVKDTYLIKHMNKMTDDAFTIKLADRLHNTGHKPTDSYKKRTAHILSQLNRVITAPQQKLIQQIYELVKD